MARQLVSDSKKVCYKMMMEGGVGGGTPAFAKYFVPGNWGCDLEGVRGQQWTQMADGGCLSKRLKLVMYVKSGSKTGWRMRVDQFICVKWIL
jgi:hypothetical protein